MTGNGKKQADFSLMKVLLATYTIFFRQSGKGDLLFPLVVDIPAHGAYIAHTSSSLRSIILNAAASRHINGVWSALSAGAQAFPAVRTQAEHLQIIG